MYRVTHLQLQSNVTRSKMNISERFILFLTELRDFVDEN